MTISDGPPVRGVRGTSVPPRPQSFQLEALFSVEVTASSGEVTPETVSELSALDPAEIPAAFAGWVEKRQREYRAGRHHARRALEAAGVFGAPVPRGDDGLPLFPRGVQGSITHTGRQRTWAAAVVCRAPHRVGLDVEERRTLSAPMLETVLSPIERERLGTGPAVVWQGQLLSDGDIALLVFSMKEAFYKTVYPATGVFLGFHEVSVDLNEPFGSFTARLVEARPEHAGIPPLLHGRFQLTERHVASGVTWSRGPLANS